jgi:exodeoxyribonuclease V beta subunit
MNSTFNVLDPNQDICGNFLIEASAGTGKTFTIAHLVARFALEPKHDMALKKMAIITFTKASASELKKRIKDLFLELKAKLENDERTFLDSFNLDKRLLLLKIDLAIETIEDALIQTIHGFSFYLLKKFALQLGLFIPQESEDNEHLDDLAYDLIFNHLRSCKTKEYLSDLQLQTLIGSSRGDLNNLVVLLRSKIVNDIEIRTPTSFFEDVEDLKMVFKNLIEPPNFESLKEASFKFKYTGLTKDQVELQLKAFYEKNFLKIVSFKTCFLEFLEEKNLKKNQVIDFLCPATDWLFQLKEKALPIIESIFNVGKIELLVSSYLKKEFANLLKEKNLLSFSSILKELESQAKNPRKAQILKNNLDCVIIDEFQDTDDTQWKIIENLFIKQPVKALYMVGDPKQAIYAFRAADIYTYIQAKEKTPHLKSGFLDVCFRSDPKLILSLNHFFSSSNWIELPFNQISLPFYPSKAAKTSGVDEKPFVFYDLNFNQDLSEEKMSDLAIQLVLTYPSDKVAILVKDRFQMDRMESFLKKKNLNFSSFKNEFLAGSLSCDLIICFLKLIESPQDTSTLNTFLISPFCHLSLDQLPGKVEQLNTIIIKAIDVFLEKGLMASFETILNTTASFFDSCFKQHLVSIHGHELIEKVYFILALLEKRVPSRSHPLLYLVEIEKLIKENTLLPQTRNLLSQIELLTTHMSKGLEFDHVIALGTSTRNYSSFKTIIKKTESGLILDLLDSSPSSTLALHEMDAEKLRQMYVAFTRAKKTLHVPLIDYSHEKITLGCMSPLEYFLMKSSFAEVDFIKCYSQFNNFSKTLISLIDHPHIDCKNDVNKPHAFGSHRSYLSLDSEIKYLSLKQNTLSSFSSLKTSSVSFSLQENFSNLKGKEYGDFFHKLIEELIRRNLYSNIESEEIKNWIFDWIDGSLFENEKQTIYNHLVFAFCVKLMTLDGEVSLKEIPFHDVLIEKDFLIQDDHLSIKGFIDLVFVFKNKLYFIDWKTSQLNGENPNDIQKYMEDSSYLLQLQIYKKALIKREDLFSAIPFGSAYFIFVKHGIAYEESGRLACTT